MIIIKMMNLCKVGTSSDDSVFCKSIETIGEITENPSFQQIKVLVSFFYFFYSMLQWEYFQFLLVCNIFKLSLKLKIIWNIYYKF